MAAAQITQITQKAFDTRDSHWLSNARKDSSLLESREEASLPPNFPQHLTSKLAWHPHDFLNEERYVFYLSDDDRREIDAALISFKELGLDGNLVDSDKFPLPNLRGKLQHLAEDLHNGNGFFVLRGLEPTCYSVEDITIIFLGIQSYIAEQRLRQDSRGNMIVHVISDFGGTPESRISDHVRHSTTAIPFHTDPTADILAFQTRGVAASGGRCVLASAYTIYNELAINRPDVIYTLARADWPFLSPSFNPRPILFHHDSKIIFSFTKLGLEGSKFHPRPSSVPSMCSRQREALDLLSSLAEKYRLEIETKAGDVHFVNNLALLHRRDRFIDHEGQRRHLVRMHLRNKKLGWDIPEPLRHDWDMALDENADEAWHIEPMPESFFPLREGSH